MSASPRDRGSVSPPSTVGTPSNAERANRACEKCTRTKKKCDKRIPACSRCTRLAAKCVYDYVIAPTVTTADPSLIANYVLNTGLSNWGTDLLNPGGEITASQVLGLLSTNGVSWQDVVNNYFLVVHPWFSVVHSDSFRRKITALMEPESGPGTSSSSKMAPSSSASVASTSTDFPQCPGSAPRRTYPTTRDSTSSSSELALLFVCMHLLTLWPQRVKTASESMTSVPTYMRAKRVLALIRTYSPPSIELVQCSALLALYEHGHGDIMRAYSTLAEAVTAANILRIGPGKYQGRGEGEELDIEEEQVTALYWSLFILDKILHEDSLCLPLPLLVGLPGADARLPAENYLWDRSKGQYRLAIRRAPVSESPTTRLGGFQRSAQVAVLGHRVIDLHRRRATRSVPPSLADGAEFEVEVRALLEAIISQASGSDDYIESFSMAVRVFITIYSGFLIFHPHPTLIHPDTTDLDILRAISGIRTGVHLIADTLDDLTEDKFEDPHLTCVSAPSCPNAIFHALINVTAFRHVLHNLDGCEESLRTRLRYFGRRWDVARVMSDEIEGFLVEGTLSDRFDSNILIGVPRRST